MHTFTEHLAQFSPLMAQEAFRQFASSMEDDLAPVGMMEYCAASEIIHGRWRLRRFLSVDESQLDQVAQVDLEKCRIRTANMVRREIADLRRRQSERQIREQLGTNLTGLASSRELVEVARAIRSGSPSKTESAEVIDIEGKIHSKLQTEIEKTKPIEARRTPRNAACPCKSGEKYKRCCGKSAPPVLSRAA